MQPEINREAEVREQVQRHIARHRPSMPRLAGTRSPDLEDVPQYRAWCATLFVAGLLGDDWPVEWGGRGVSDPLRDIAIEDELVKARVPRAIGAWNLVSAALFEHGSESQRSHYLPRIRSFDDIWCQLFSEPEAGSDLASLRTTAKLTDAGWVLNGQKVWTTHAQVADFGFLLARTEPDLPKHDGISAFALDMRCAGVDVRPLREITGSSDFNEVFLTDVLVPPTALIGERGQGWQIARSALSHERSQSVREDPVTDKVRRLLRLAAERNDRRPSLADADVRQALGRLYARSVAVELLGLENVLRESADSSRPYDAAVTKVLFSETNYDVVGYAADFLGPDIGTASGELLSIDDGYWQNAFLYARGYTISAGSNEVMRNVIAERGLGLPR